MKTLASFSDFEAPHSCRHRMGKMLVRLMRSALVILVPLIPITSMAVEIYDHFPDTIHAKERYVREPGGTKPPDILQGSRHLDGEKTWSVLSTLAGMVGASQGVDRGDQSVTMEISSPQGLSGDTPNKRTCAHPISSA
jgi:hypothetical protein